MAIATICVHCGGKEADPQTGRCLKCGKRAMSPALAEEFSHPVLDRGIGQSRPSPSGAYRGNGSVAVVESPSLVETPLSPPAPLLATEPVSPPPVSFALPDNPATTKWIRDTRELIAKLIARAEQAEATIEDLKLAAARNRESVRAFTQLLEQISVGDAHARTPESPPPGQVVQERRRVRGLREV